MVVASVFVATWLAAGAGAFAVSVGACAVSPLLA